MIVVHGSLVHVDRKRRAGDVAAEQPVRFLMAILARGLAAHPVDGAIARRGDNPPGRAGRDSIRGPALHRDDEGVLHGLFREIDIAEVAHEDGHRAAVLRAEHPIDFGAVEWTHGRGRPPHSSRNGLTSIGERRDRARGLPRPFERCVQIGCLDDQEAADVLLRLRVRPISDEHVAVLEADTVAVAAG